MTRVRPSLLISLLAVGALVAAAACSIPSSVDARVYVCLVKDSLPASGTVVCTDSVTAQ